MELTVKPFDALTTRELYELLQARAAVFVVEQKCPYQDIDGQDEGALHLCLREEGELLAYARVLPPERQGGTAKIGRVISLRRRQGLASILLQEGIRQAKETFGAKRVCVEAQSYARSLYEKAGFVRCSEEFLEDGIPHIRMERDT